uniref:Uncharacterized protein n=1 Tax=Peromyscus maniculatus bairdii TaxID=230844 RepID=A0A8C8URV3_PERMB
MPGTRPMRRTIMCRQLLLVSSLTALPIVVLSRLSPFTSVILSPTHRPARSAPERGRVSGPHTSVDTRLCPPIRSAREGSTFHQSPPSERRWLLPLAT